MITWLTVWLKNITGYTTWRLGSNGTVGFFPYEIESLKIQVTKQSRNCRICNKEEIE